MYIYFYFDIYHQCVFHRIAFSIFYYVLIILLVISLLYHLIQRNIFIQEQALVLLKRFRVSFDLHKDYSFRLIIAHDTLDTIQHINHTLLSHSYELHKCNISSQYSFYCPALMEITLRFFASPSFRRTRLFSFSSTHAILVLSFLNL